VNTIEWSTKAARQLRKIPDKAKRQSIFAEVQQLADWPNCTSDIKRLRGRDDYRLRVGDYRVIFEIDQSGTPIIITITQVEKRNERTY
jgi:mRNA-degrading endonuclease RelE of RelBE toxin-antitoxin system